MERESPSAWDSRKRHTQVVLDFVRLLLINRFAQRTLMQTIVTKPIPVPHVLLLLLIEGTR